MNIPDLISGGLTPLLSLPVAPSQSMSAKINNSIERQMVSAASAGKLSIMKPATQGGSTGQEATEKAAKCVAHLLTLFW